MTKKNDIEQELADLLHSVIRPEVTQVRAMGLAVALHHEWARSEGRANAGSLRRYLKENFNVKLKAEEAVGVWKVMSWNTATDTPNKTEEVLTVRLVDGKLETYQGHGFEISTRDGIWLRITAEHGLKANCMAYNVRHVLSWDVSPATVLGARPGAAL